MSAYLAAGLILATLALLMCIPSWLDRPNRRLDALLADALAEASEGAERGARLDANVTQLSSLGKSHNR